MTPADDTEGTPPKEARDDDVVEPTPTADPGESPAAGSGAEEIAQETDAPPAAGTSAESDSGAEAGDEGGAETEQPTEAAPEAEQPTEAAPEAEQPTEAATEAERTTAPEASASSEPSADSEQAAAEPRRREPRRRGDERQESGEEVVPGAHLEPDLVLDEPQAGEDEFAQYAVEDEEPAPEQAAASEQEPQAGPVARTPMDLAADARYRATGKRKSAVARVILRPGGGDYRINGRELAEFFPRETLRVTARQPLDAAGYSQRMDVVAKIHGGGVSSQAGALRHGIARALVEADPNLRAELKRRGFLTRDARQKERKKAGLKKARKRPQFSKR